MYQETSFIRRNTPTNVIFHWCICINWIAVLRPTGFQSLYVVVIS